VNQPPIRLYASPGTPYTEKVIAALRLKGLDFETVEPRRPEDLRRWSPETGLLPVIEIDGERTPDSAAILDRLEALFPDPPLTSRDPKVAREQRRLEEWVSETFGFYMMRWLAQKLGRDPSSGPKRDEEGNAIGPLARLGLIGADGRISPEAMDTSDGGPGPEFERRIADLAAMLGDRRWFHADALSRADLAVYAALFGMYTERFPGGRQLIARHPALLAFCDRVHDAIERAGGRSERAEG
jgi:glutathione S-transferase